MSFQFLQDIAFNLVYSLIPLSILLSKLVVYSAVFGRIKAMEDQKNREYSYIYLFMYSTANLPINLCSFTSWLVFEKRELLKICYLRVYHPLFVVWIAKQHSSWFKSWRHFLLAYWLDKTLLWSRRQELCRTKLINFPH